MVESRNLAGEVGPPLPYARLNLRRNPFGDLNLAERAELAIVNVASIVARLDNPRYAVQFVGEKGFGKTTHLLAILRQLPQATYYHIPEGTRPPVPQGSPLMIDESQRLTHWQRWSVFRRRTALVLGTHQDHRRALQRVGRSVETIHVADRMNTDRLTTLLNARIRCCQRGPGPIPSIRRATAQLLLQRFGPDIRTIEDTLYSRFQSLREVQDV